ncbi:hypothetical protein PBAC_15960 [Pedobacter glucosidilyticus]|nr:hypothetical protein [Pedobacter glucosidilyticus]KHJ38220.1 hypothetical protein PBAC_15960 [Pedobacter glucosidilyticus]
MSDFNAERESEIILSYAQIALLKLSDLDIENQQLISQDDLDKEDTVWITDKILKNS